jgi:hypothetical protein
MPKSGRLLNIESAHRIQMKSLPKYEIVISSCYARVGWALFFMANEDDVLDNGGSTLDNKEGGDNIRAK